jgi:DNA-binding MarR family transcriptional regulator
MSWAWKQALPPTEKFILLALADHANDEDYTCWPSLKHLTRKTGFSRPTIWKTVNRLIALGIVARVGESAAGSTKYLILVGKALTQVTRLPNIGNDVNRVGNYGNKVGNDVTPNHQEPSRTITESSAGAPRAASPADAVPLITLTLNTGKEYPITENQRAEWGTLFPATDVLQELRKMRAWLLANPRNRKTPRGILRFVTSWLSREQDRARSPRHGAQHETHPPVDNSAPARVRRAYAQRARQQQTEAVIDGTAERVD